MPFSFVLLFRKALVTLVKQKWKTAFLTNDASLLLCTPGLILRPPVCKPFAEQVIIRPVHAQNEYSSGKNIVK